MARIFKSVAAVFSDIATRKHRAATTRIDAAAHGGPKPRDIYLSACAEIARRFEGEGFTYTKSHQRTGRTVIRTSSHGFALRTTLRATGKRRIP